jgi:hypothetical protein
MRAEAGEGMSRSGVRRFLAAYFAVVAGAVVFQVDRFPLTWVPMYSIHSHHKADRPQRVEVRDPGEAAKGLFVTRRDGSKGRVGIRELNLPRRNMWRLYYERPFKNGPPKYLHANQALDGLSRWVRGLERGEPNLKANWSRRLFASVNRTLGLRPEDPRFVVEIEAFQEIRYYHDFELTRTRTRHAHLRWKKKWAKDYE